MKATYWQKGDAIDYKNETSATIEAGTVVEIADHIGIAGNDILPGDTQPLIVEGCFKMQKAAESFEMGDNLYYDPTNNCVTKLSEETDETVHVHIGYAAAAATEGATEAIIKLIG